MKRVGVLHKRGQSGKPRGKGSQPFRYGVFSWWMADVHYSVDGEGGERRSTEAHELAKSCLWSLIYTNLDV